MTVPLIILSVCALGLGIMPGGLTGAIGNIISVILPV